MKTPCKDFPLDNLMRRSVVDDSVSGKLLTALWAFKIALCVVFNYHICVTLNQCPETYFPITVKLGVAFAAIHRDDACFPFVFTHKRISLE